MKIIQLLQKPQLRGAEIFACQLSNHLAEQGQEILVVSIFNGDSKLPFSGKTIHLNRPLNKRLFDLKAWKQFSKIIEDFKPDIVQANAADTLKFAVSSKILYRWNVPIVFRNANKMGDFITSKLKWQLNNFFLSKISYAISVSKECEKDFIKTFNYDKGNIETIEIGVEEQKPGKIPPDLAEIFKKGQVITHIGGFVAEKNHEGLLAIFDKVVKKHPEVQLFLTGKGNLQSSIKEKVKQLNLKGNVNFLEYRNDVLDILYHSKIFVLPSLIEGLPAVILEAMYCKTPVVAYNVGGISEVVTQATGKLIPKGDEIAFAKAIVKTLEDPDEKQIENAHQIVVQHYMNRQIAEKFLKAYRKVVV